VFAEAILGHLVGDFILHDDWQAANKAGPPLTEDQHWQVAAVYGDARHAALDHYERVQRWKGHLACAVHCLLWAAAVALFGGLWGPYELAWLFGSHFAIDRFRLARRFMALSRHEAFATGPLAPWSVVVTDQILHLLTIWALTSAPWVT
jgi:hypothetical protein